jgi:hypothetical protein
MRRATTIIIIATTANDRKPRAVGNARLASLQGRGPFVCTSQPPWHFVLNRSSKGVKMRPQTRERTDANHSFA